MISACINALWCLLDWRHWPSPGPNLELQGYEADKLLLNYPYYLSGNV